ncbi:hypothetical protein BH23ACT4_BH23ACT4_04610 [soil metagenome]
MRGMSLRPYLVVLVVLSAMVLVACGPAGGSGTIAGGEPRFPILGNDPDGLVETMEWGESPALDLTPSGEDTLAEVLDSSSPEVVLIAVEGNECPPSARVLVGGSPDDVTIEMVLGGSLPPAGVECGDILTTHALLIYFKEPIDLDNLEVSATRTGD